MTKEIRTIQIVISVIATLIAIVHIALPALTMDAITLTLLVLAIAPWTAPLIKSIKLPGGTEIKGIVGSRLVSCFSKNTSNSR